MMQFDRMALGKKARELGFVRDTFEKICRLVNVVKSKIKPQTKRTDVNMKNKGCTYSPSSILHKVVHGTIKM